MNFTHGGYPESESWGWTSENQKKLGAIVAGLMANDSAKQTQARLDYYELKRHFLVDEWCKYISDLSDYRKENGFLTISELLAKVKPYLIEGVCMSNKEAMLKIAEGFSMVAAGIMLALGEEKSVTAGKAVEVSPPPPPAKKVDYGAIRDEIRKLAAEKIIPQKGQAAIVSVFNNFMTPLPNGKGKKPVEKLKELLDADLEACLELVKAEATREVASAI